MLCLIVVDVGSCSYQTLFNYMCLVLQWVLGLIRHGSTWLVLESLRKLHVNTLSSLSTKHPLPVGLWLRFIIKIIIWIITCTAQWNLVHIQHCNKDFFSDSMQQRLFETSVAKPFRTFYCWKWLRRSVYNQSVSYLFGSECREVPLGNFLTSLSLLIRTRIAAVLSYPNLHKLM